MDQVLNDMFLSIIDAVKKSENKKQRHKKVFIDKSGKQVALGQITDVTSTHFQNTYQNSNSGSIIGTIVGKDGVDVSLNCFTDRPRSDLIFEQIVLKELKPDVSNNVIATYKEMLFMREEIETFISKYGIYLEHPNYEDQETLQIEFQSRLCLPPTLNQYLITTSKIEKKEILKLILDVELRKLLSSNIPPEGRKIMEQFLKSREATFGSQISSELQVELQHLELDAFGDKDKCVLTFFYNIKKALGLNDNEMYQASTNIKQLTIGKGVDRTQTYLYPHYDTLVRTERCKVAARRSITLFSSGLGKITKGLQDPKLSQASVNLIKGGMTTIFNFENCSQEDKCNKFAVGKESAASAILMMYMEFMDYMINPSPPLMFRKDMKVTTLYQSKEYDEENYDTWSSDKKTKFRDDYLKFCARYMNVGFTFTSQRGKHGMLLLNLNSWGEGEIVVNPFRVKEDTLLYKYFGNFRLQPNRLGIGSITRKMWLNHKIKYDFDPTYCDQFKKKQDFYPRPIFDPNYYTTDIFETKIPHFSQLYCNVPPNVKNASINATNLRNHLNSLSVKQFIELDPNELQRNLMDETPLNKKWFVIENEDEKWSRESSALFDIWLHFRSSVYDDLKIFKDVIFQQDKTKQIVVPKYSSNEGSQINEDGLHLFKINETCFNSIFGKIPLEALLHPPQLNDPHLHPFFNRIDKSQKWSTNETVSFPYPLKNLSGELTQPVFPVCERKINDGWHPFKQRKPYQFEIFPKSSDPDTIEAWDLRNSLVCLLGQRAQSSMETTLNTIKKIPFVAKNNDLKVLDKCEKNWLLYESLPNNSEAFTLEEDPLYSDRSCFDIKSSISHIKSVKDKNVGKKLKRRNSSSPSKKRNLIVDVEPELEDGEDHKHVDEDVPLTQNNNDDDDDSPLITPKSSKNKLVTPKFKTTPKSQKTPKTPVTQNDDDDSPLITPKSSTKSKNKLVTPKSKTLPKTTPKIISPVKKSGTKFQKQNKLTDILILRKSPFRLYDPTTTNLSKNKTKFYLANDFILLPKDLNKIHVNSKQLNKTIALIEHALNQNPNAKILIPVNKEKISILFNEKELSSDDVRSFIDKLSKLQAKYISEPSDNIGFLKIFPSLTSKCRLQVLDESSTIDHNPNYFYLTNQKLNIKNELMIDDSVDLDEKLKEISTILSSNFKALIVILINTSTNKTSLFTPEEIKQERVQIFLNKLEELLNCDLITYF